MEKNFMRIFHTGSLSDRRWKLLLTGLLFSMIIFSGLPVFAQNTQTIKGKVVDDKDESLIGVTVVLLNTTNGTTTDIDGNFSLTIPTGTQTLKVSFVGMETQEVSVTGSTPIKVVLKESSVELDEVVVVGYGKQAKASIVGSISQTSSQVLERSGGVSSLGMALTGNLPGLITYNSTGMPGDEDPRIVIRSQSSWNSSDPLILVDGIERPMNTVDISSVENISVLKDASATAVYGVRGANGVILITTKRGQEGKASVQIRANATMKIASKLPEKYDSYDALVLRNSVIERELGISPLGWGDYRPMNIINKYRYPANADEWDRYPNVDWEDELFKKSAMAYNVNASVSGGTKFVRYFASLDYQHEGDLFKVAESNRGYKSGFFFNRANVRSNLDFHLTNSTTFSSNLFGSYGVRTRPWGASTDANSYWASVYLAAPDAMRPVYSDGSFGWYAPRNADVPNSVYSLSSSGIENRTTTQISTDFTLVQNLDMITKGLSAKAILSLDNRFLEQQRGINDTGNDNESRRKWINPVSGEISYTPNEDHQGIVRWSTQAGNVDRGQTYRKTYYSAQINYDRKFDKHNVTALGLFSRERRATGSEFPRYREDWVFRVTYNYAMKYLAEINGAYNGSEKFGPDYRFAFFPSFSGGWVISEENFMKSLTFLDMLKVRASWGKIGDDSAGGRWLYQDQWAYGGNTQMGSPPANTPYTMYRISALGNPDVSWETVEKRNLGFDYSFLKGFLTGSVDIFNDIRTDILVSGGNRAIPTYFGTTAPIANLGEVETKGFELEFRLNHVFNNGLRLWLNSNITHATNKVIFADDPELRPDHRKTEGYAIGQTRSYLDYGFIESWDDLYGSTVRETNNGNKIPGDFNIIDYDGDGIITADDQAPYQYSGVPQNTYSTSFGFEWKGFSCFVQFYGVSNVTRSVDFPTFRATHNVAYHEGIYWTVDGGGDIPMPRWTTVAGTGANGTRHLYDASYLRLKNAEIAYTIPTKTAEKLKMKSCRIFLNGDNLLLWTKMPDDRENNFSGGGGSGAYPTVRRFNLGFSITL